MALRVSNNSARRVHHPLSRTEVKYILLVYLLIYFALAFVLPSYRVWKRTGVNPVTFSGADDTHDYIGKLFKIVMLGLTLVVILYAFAPQFYPFTLPVVWLENKAVQFAGIGLLLLSLGWTVAAQIQMGNSWRIGIDEEKQTALVESGLFRFSRNPIFLGMLVTLLGFFLAAPNALTLLISVLGFVLIQIQVRLEEEFLLKTRGVDYDEYRRRVRRWL
ncbi:MAG: isoprenylcysteine carboxylmethyltransferase family protein [Pyrinomonadaceae bacterium]|nr:isoprenylcysteine carboxylmethyltransferase family protein [Pyrinomonadaceae bacterium]